MALQVGNTTLPQSKFMKTSTIQINYIEAVDKSTFKETIINDQDAPQNGDASA